MQELVATSAKLAERDCPVGISSAGPLSAVVDVSLLAASASALMAVPPCVGTALACALRLPEAYVLSSRWCVWEGGNSQDGRLPVV